MQSQAATVPEYLESLSPERRVEIDKVRAVVNRNRSRGFEERMSYGMISWVVPHRVFPAGYHCDPKQPLPFAGLASQKNYCSVYVPLVVPVRGPGMEEGTELQRWFVDAWERTGRKLDKGKVCIRFRRADDLALDVLGELFRRQPLEEFVADYVAALERLEKGGPKRSSARKAPARASRSRK